MNFKFVDIDISSVYMVGHLNLHQRKQATYWIFFDSGKQMLVYHEDPNNESISEPIMNRDKFIKLWKKCRPRKFRLI